MTTNTKISERIKQLIEYKEISINKFAEKVGASNSYFNKVINHGTSIGSDKIKSIINAFPDINPTWLVIGTGNMLIDKNLNAVCKTNNFFDSLSYQNMTEENKILKERISIQQQTITMLKEKIELLELQIAKKNK